MNDDICNQINSAEETKRLIRKQQKLLWIQRFRREHPEARVQEYQRLKADLERYARFRNKQKRWREAHPDYQRLWRAKHPDKPSAARKAYVAAWKAAHPER